MYIPSQPESQLKVKKRSSYNQLISTSKVYKYVIPSGVDFTKELTTKISRKS